MIRVIVGLVLLLTCSSVYASPFLHFQLEGRRQGSTDPFASNVEVSLGDVVEYRLRLKLAAPDAANLHNPPQDPDQLGRHGLNSMSAVIVQEASDPIQVDFQIPANLSSTPVGWDQGTGARGGHASLRPGSTWHDLTDIRPIHGPGIFTGVAEETVFGGLFTVADVSGASGQLSAAWGTISGGGWFEGQVFFITPTTESTADPFAQFTPLTLTAGNLTPVPEPSTVVLAATALTILLLRRKSLRRTT